MLSSSQTTEAATSSRVSSRLPQIPRHPLAQFGQRFGKGDEARVFRLVAVGRPALVIAVLLAAALVAPGRLDVAVRVGRDPYVGPGRRDGERPDAGQRLLVLDTLAIGRRDSRTCARRFDAADAGLRVADVTKLGFLRRKLRIGCDGVGGGLLVLREQGCVPETMCAGLKLLPAAKVPVGPLLYLEIAMVYRRLPVRGVLPPTLRSIQMQKRRLGRTDLHVSAICLGTMTWGQQNTEAEGHEQMDLAFDRGVNFLDTAELYSIPPKPETQGSTESIIGNWMKARRNRDKRHPGDQSRRPHAKHMVSRRPAVEAGARRHLRRHRKIAEAAADRLCRPLPDPLPERPVPWGANPTRVGNGAARARRGRDADRRDACRLRRAGEGRKDPPSRHLERKLLGPDALRRRERQGRRSARGLDPERLQPRQPHASR